MIENGVSFSRQYSEALVTLKLLPPAKLADLVNVDGCQVKLATTKFIRGMLNILLLVADLAMVMVNAGLKLFRQ